MPLRVKLSEQLKIFNVEDEFYIQCSMLRK